MIVHERDATRQHLHLNIVSLIQGGRRTTKKKNKRPFPVFEMNGPHYNLIFLLQELKRLEKTNRSLGSKKNRLNHSNIRNKLSGVLRGVLTP